MKRILKVRANKEGKQQVINLKKGYTWIQGNYYGGELYANNQDERLLIIYSGHDEMIEVRKLI